MGQHMEGWGIVCKVTLRARKKIWQSKSMKFKSDIPSNVTAVLCKQEYSYYHKLACFLSEDTAKT